MVNSAGMRRIRLVLTREVPASIESIAGKDKLSGSHIDDTIDGKVGAVFTDIVINSSNTTAHSDRIRAHHTKDDGATVCLSSIENLTGSGTAGSDLDVDVQANTLTGGADSDTFIVMSGEGDDIGSSSD